MKRTNTDFSKHEHKVELYKCGEKQIRIDHFQVGNSRHDYIQFINTDEVMTVTGDYGNWVFCRPFIPTKGQTISDSYWIEKLKISSEQKLRDLDFDYMADMIKAEIKELIAEYGEEDNERYNTEMDWYENLLEACEGEDEIQYLSLAYRDSPNWKDYDDVPISYKTPIWLQIIFDAFEEMCSRMSDN